MESIIDRMSLLQKVYNTTMAKMQNIIEKEKEYYTPNIEDIRIGYECEIQTNYGYEEFNDGKETWLPITINLKEPNGAYNRNVSDIVIGIDDGYQPVRTKHLTKDQIEAEGFTILKKSDNNYIYATKGKFTEMRYDMGHVTLAIYNTIDAGSEAIKLPAFYGECKSINEFRFINKLLRI